jgi:hypothetical protein
MTPLVPTMALVGALAVGNCAPIRPSPFQQMAPFPPPAQLGATDGGHADAADASDD